MVWWLMPGTTDVLQPQFDVSVFQKGVGELQEGAVVHPGAEIMMQLRGEQESYVYVLNAAEREPGEVNLLFPTDLDLENPLAASATHYLPGYQNDRPVYWNFTSPGGKETLLLVVARQPLDEIDSNYTDFNRLRLRREVDHISPTPEAQAKQRGVGGLSLGKSDVLVHLERTLKETYGDNVWIWSMQLRCESEGTVLDDVSTSGESSSEKSGEEQ